MDQASLLREAVEEQTENPDLELVGPQRFAEMLTGIVAFIVTSD